MIYQKCSKYLSRLGTVGQGDAQKNNFCIVNWMLVDH